MKPAARLLKGCPWVRAALRAPRTVVTASGSERKPTGATRIKAPQASDAVEVTNLPEGVTVTSLDWKETPVTKPNMKGKESVAVPSTVHIEFSDGSSRDVAVNINVTSQSVKYTPETQDKTYNLKDTVKPQDFITNINDLPQGTTFEWNGNDGVIDTITAGSQTGEVLVTKLTDDEKAGSWW